MGASSASPSPAPLRFSASGWWGSPVFSRAVSSKHHPASNAAPTVARAAAFDVFHVEPANGNPLLDVPNFYGSPHIGATTRDSWSAMLRSGMHGIEHAYRQEPGVYPYD